MENIYDWLHLFKEKWLKKNIPEILNLFSDEVKYFENPKKQLNNKRKIREVWNEITYQNNIILEFKVISKEGDKYKVQWNLQYEIKDRTCNYSGLYYISLDNKNKCTYFLQTE